MAILVTIIIVYLSESSSRVVIDVCMIIHNTRVGTVRNSESENINFYVHVVSSTFCYCYFWVNRSEFLCSGTLRMGTPLFGIHNWCGGQHIFIYYYYLYLLSEPTRVKLLQLCLREVVLAENVNLSELAIKLDGYSGSDISNLCRYLHKICH